MAATGDGPLGDLGKVLARQGFPLFTLLLLRSGSMICGTAASRCFSRSAFRLVRSWRSPGHSTLDMTMTVYGHVSLSDKRSALDQLGELFGEGS